MNWDVASYFGVSTKKLMIAASKAAPKTKNKINRILSLITSKISFSDIVSSICLPPLIYCLFSRLFAYYYYITTYAVSSCSFFVFFSANFDRFLTSFFSFLYKGLPMVSYHYFILYFKRYSYLGLNFWE